MKKLNIAKILFYYYYYYGYKQDSILTVKIKINKIIKSISYVYGFTFCVIYNGVFLTKIALAL